MTCHLNLRHGKLSGRLCRTIVSLGLCAAIIPALCGCKGSGKGNTAPDNSLQITESEIIKFDGSMLDCMLDSFEVIYLDDSREALVSDISDIRYDDGRFFILSTGGWENSSVMVFDSTGHYLHNIGHQGNASYEYNNLSGWTLDPVRNEVIIVQLYPSQIYYYGYDGKFLRKRSIGESDITFSTDRIHGFMPDGTLLLKNHLHTYPVDDYVMIRPNDSISVPFDRRDYKMGQIEDWQGDYSIEYEGFCTANASDDIWLMRRFDNHIYRICGIDSIECVANLSFVEELPEDVRRDFNFMGDKYFSSILSDITDTRDFMIIKYSDGAEYIFEKSTSKVYRSTWNDQTFKRIPFASTKGCYDNTLIGLIDIMDAENWLTSNQDDDSDDRSDDSVRAVFSKAARRDNPTLLLYHLKSPEL